MKTRSPMLTRLFWKSFRLLSACLLLAGPATLTANPPEAITIEGSDFLAAPVRELAEALAAEGDPAEWRVRLQGSLPAYNAMREGGLQLGMLFEDPHLTGKSAGYRLRPVGYLVVHAVVHERNPLDTLRLDRLTGIFGEAEGFDLLRWGDVGVAVWEDRIIRSFRVDGKVDLAASFFQHRVLRQPRFKERVTVTASPSRLFDALRDQEAAIGLVGLVPPVAAGWKALALAPDPDSLPVAPTLESVHFGEYPLRLPLLLVYPENAEAELRPVLLEFFSDRFAGILRRHGYYPLPPGSRERLRLEIGLGRP